MRKAKAPHPLPVDSPQEAVDGGVRKREKFSQSKPRRLRLEVVMDYRVVDYHYLMEMTGIDKRNYDKTIEHSETPAPKQIKWWKDFARALCVGEDWLSSVTETASAPEWYENHKHSLLVPREAQDKELIAAWQDALDGKYKSKHEEQISDWIAKNPDDAYLLRSFHRSIAFDRGLEFFSIAQKSALCSAWAINGPTIRESVERLHVRNQSRKIINWNRSMRNRYVHRLSNRFLLTPGACFQCSRAEHPAQYTSPFSPSAQSNGKERENRPLSMTYSSAIKYGKTFDAIVHHVDETIMTIIARFEAEPSKELAVPLSAILNQRSDVFNTVFHDDPEMDIGEAIAAHRTWRKSLLNVSERNSSLFSLAEKLRADVGKVSAHDVLQIGRIYSERDLLSALCEVTSGKAFETRKLVDDLVSRRKIHVVNNLPWYLYLGNDSPEILPRQ